MKYIKYLIIQNPPPNKEDKKQLNNYFKKILKKTDVEENLDNNGEENIEENDEENIEDNIKGNIDENIYDAIVNNIDNFLQKNDNKELIEVCENKGLEEYDIYKVIMIVEFIKKINKNNINKENTKEKNEENNEAAPNYYEVNTPKNNEGNDKYLSYCVVEVFEYETSQNEISFGMRNPIDEFKRICKDFEVKNEKNANILILMGQIKQN